MSENRTLSQGKALAGLLAIVADVLVTGVHQLFVENKPQARIDAAVLLALEEAFDIYMSYCVEDATQETRHGAP